MALPALSVIAPNAGAQGEAAVDGTLVEFATVPMDEWKAYSVALQGGDSLTYAVTVTSGSRIDVYFLDDANYGLYKDPFAASFGYYVRETQENTMAVAGSFRPSGSDTYWIVVDNVALTTTGANPTGNVTVNVSFTKVGNVFGNLLVIGVIVLVAVIVVVIIAAYLVMRKGKQPPTPETVPPAYVPGPMDAQTPPGPPRPPPP